MENVFEKQYYHNSIHSSNVDPFDDNDSSFESPKDHKRIEHIIRTGYVYFFSLSAVETISNRRSGNYQAYEYLIGSSMTGCAQCSSPYNPGHQNINPAARSAEG